MKRLYNFYLDDSDKMLAENKLERLCGKQNKGQLAALLRVFIKQFIGTPDDKTNPLLLEAVEAEYVLCTKSNKRSRM